MFVLGSQIFYEVFLSYYWVHSIAPCQRQSKIIMSIIWTFVKDLLLPKRSVAICLCTAKYWTSEIQWEQSLSNKWITQPVPRLTALDWPKL